MSTPLTDVKGIGPISAEKLAASGIASAEALAAATPEQLAGVSGFGAFRAARILENARQLVADAAPPADAGIVAGETDGLRDKKGKARKSKTKPKKKGKAGKKTASKKKPDKKQEKKAKQKKSKDPAAKDKKGASKKNSKKKKKKDR